MGASQSTAQLKQRVFAGRKQKHGFKPKATVFAAYTGVFLMILSVVAVGYQSPQRVETVASAADTSISSADQPSVDQLVATNVAAGVAERTDSPIATNVANLSVSLSAESQLAQNDTNTISKPQIVQPTADNRKIRTYTAKSGDSIPKVANQFGITNNTLKWANNMNSDAIEKNRKLTIPPVDGVIHTVKGDETAESIASKYKADAQRVITFNDLELGGLEKGSKIMVPGGVKPAENNSNDASGQSSGGALNQGGAAGGFNYVNTQMASSSAGNRYAFGNCTAYAFDRRAELGRPIGSFWGNAATWAMNARAAGFTVNNTPEAGAIAQWDAYQGGSYVYGHVAMVESVNSDGSITISEMNYLGNFNRVTSRTISAGSVSNFIH